MEEKYNQSQGGKRKKLPASIPLVIIMVCWLIFYIYISIHGGTG